MAHSDPQSFLPLSNATLHILLALAGGGRLGYAIMKEVVEATGGTITLGHGTLYRTLESLLERGLIEESTRRPAKDEDQRRRYYRLTGVGGRVVAAESQRLAAIVALARAKKVLQKAPA